MAKPQGTKRRRLLLKLGFLLKRLAVETTGMLTHGLRQRKCPAGSELLDWN